MLGVQDLPAGPECTAGGADEAEPRACAGRWRRAGRRVQQLRQEDPDHRDRPAQPARARPQRPGLPPLRPHPHAAPPRRDRQPRRDAALARRAERARAQQAQCRQQLRSAAEQKRAEDEADRPGCAGCGTTFDNDRWQITRLSPTPGSRCHPTLCEPCEAKTVATEDQAERDRLEQEAAETAEKAPSGWRSRFRPGQAP